MQLSPDEQARRQYLLLTLVEAATLKVGDLNGLSDPYCMIRVGTHNFRTRTISETLNPVWNYSLRVYELVDDVTAPLRLYRETCGQETLHLQVWDEDTFSTDDFLGEVSIPLYQTLRENAWYPVRTHSLLYMSFFFLIADIQHLQLQPRDGKNDKKIRGSVRLQLLWEADIARRQRMEQAVREWNATWLAEAQLQGLPIAAAAPQNNR